ncbi:MULTISPECIES: RtcB family protein [Acidiplasma]|uniref:tRNA-splicing ligase RtcB n=2 Tax=Acidiplasma TaxID=507753 RepID=A0A0Q0RUS1_9ARCH|nr:MULTISPECIES: RtcB family protein [Acidiplasma]KJE49052.1 tRNA-splicing ligase [Acidiplasma sp. MBA-1]KPV47170.1 tRNA-splicing ligase [Acidiplasma aeolicum]KQB34436.1 tRNA-splicing ligase [Acidiplasma aeolicum]KQB36070.1 tRNA-splicing ligase [Acidiplasma cupricumulans]WMT54498.1 MAG: RtcB family protein [Acidiplasma sp.]
MFNLKKISEFAYELPEDQSMKVPGIIYINDTLLKNFTNDEPIKQVRNVASLPGIVKASIAMPDIHMGYGFPIGGVAAFDYDNGIVSPGGVGYDINCGVTLIKTNLKYQEVRNKIADIIENLYKSIPAGIDHKSSLRLNQQSLSNILSEGIYWALENGYATENDMLNTEESGKIECDASYVSEKAMARGINELGTLGGGNHFLEIQRVSSIMDDKTSKMFGMEPDQVTIMVHTGSRGLGHQVATDFITEILNSGEGIKNENDKQLTSVYISSKIGQRYINSMNAAANFSFVNRQIITYKIRKVFEETFKRDYESLGMDILYSLAHNMAKQEYHIIENTKRKLLVHRKGATRAFPAGVAEGKFSSTGYPVIIPGDMGTASYVLVGTQENMKNSFGSSCHGAGRVLSRKASNEKFTPESVLRELNDRGIYIRAATKKVITEESPESYKDIDEVIKVVNGANIARPVLKLTPLAVMKG